MDSKRVLVTGATGQQGGAVARLLLSRGHHVRSLVRKPDSTAAEALRAAGAELVTGAMDDRAAIDRAVSGMDSVFLVTTPFEAGMDAEVRQGTVVADAAHQAGAHLVFTSVAWAWANTGIPHFDSKWKVEQHIVGLGMAASVLGPVYFMENAIASWSLDALRQGLMAVPLTEGVRTPQIAVDTIAEFAVLAIEHPERLRGKRIDIASDTVTGPEAAAAVSRASGKAVRYHAVPLEAVRAQSEDLGLMFEYFETKQPQIDVEALRREYPEVRWRTYEEWANAQDWSRILGQSAKA
jgi:uncharacterized protein YbjT (DUF2867 family)